MTTNPLDIINEASRRGLHLEPRGDRLAVIPGRNCSADFAAILRAHKRELLDFLGARKDGLPTDSAAWLHIARQVLAGEFNGADRSMLESLIIGLRSIPHATAKKAHDRVRENFNRNQWR